MNVITDRYGKPSLNRKLRDLGRIGAVIALVLFAAGAFAQERFDLVIKNGRVMDPETGFDGVANVGIRGGEIVSITTQALSGALEIDASGHVVSPGFIDFHVHGQDPFSIKVGLRDGVTSPLELEAGAYPVEAYYAGRAGKSQANYGASVGHMVVRLTKLDKLDLPGGLPLYADAVNRAAQDGSKWSTERTNPGSEERRAIMDGVEEGLKQGGLGIGFPVGYYTSVSSNEVFEVAELASKYNSFILTHVRYLSQIPPSGFLGIQEFLSAAQVHEVPLIVQHLPTNCLGLSQQCLDMLNTAREKGVKVAAEFYPWEKGSSIIGADYLAPGFQERIGMDYSDITMVATGETLDEESYKKYRAEQPGAAMIMHHIKKPDMLAAFNDPFAFVGSDAFPYIDKSGKPLAWDAAYEEGLGHPRGAGTHAKLLRMARENDSVSLMEAVAKLSFYQADFIDEMVPDMRVRGRMQEGMIADITIFDPATVTENSDYPAGKGALPSTGIPYVIVNGTVVVEDSKVLKDVYPGQPIRNPIID